MFSTLLRKQKKSTQSHTLLINGEEITLILRENPRARRLILRRAKKGNGFVVTLPSGCNPDQGINFALEHQNWMAQQIKSAPQKIILKNGSCFPFKGRMYEICHKPHDRGVVWLDDNQLTPLIFVAGKEAHIERRVKDWLKKQARQELSLAAERYARELNIHFKSISLRDQTTRWGSCSSQGNLSFSWRLILAPSKVLDYVAAHEVAHLIEMNHSAAFWEIVKSLDPTYKQQTKWLKENGPTLYQYFS